MRTTVRKKGQVTLAKEVLERAHLEEGDLIEVEVTPKGLIVLRPQKVIEASQAWFWTPEWQAREREANEDIVAGRVQTFESDEEFLKSFDD